MNKYFIFDFDSTFVSIESLDKLAEISLKKNPNKDKILKEIQNITKKGMEGKVSFQDSLSFRIGKFTSTKNDVAELIEILKKSITPSINRNKNFFKLYRDQIYIISGGFQEYILPIAKTFGIRQDHVLANTFIFDKDKIIGFDKKNLLTKSGGKAKSVKSLNLKGEVYVLGDGYTDYEIKKINGKEEFVAFTEIVRRDDVIKKTNFVVKNLDEFLYRLNLPRSFSFPKSKIKVLLLENIHKEAIENFKSEGYDVKTYSKAISKKELLEEIKDVNILGIRSKTDVSKDIIKSAKKLICIGAFCIGTNQIDLDSCAKHGVPVFNSPYGNTRSVVELVLGEMIMLARKVFLKSTQLHSGNWQKSTDGCFEIRGKNLGIIGYGNIGSQLSVLAENLGMNVYYYDIEDKLSMSNAKSCSSLEELLKISDIITLHVDGRSSNKNLIGESEFRKMKDGVIFINASRGFVVNVDDMVANIKSGKIKGAAVDVYPKEPKGNGAGFNSPLTGLDNVILTPHVGGATLEAQKNIGKHTSKKLISFVNTGNTTMSVNFPQINLQETKDVCRLIHVHKNVPGVLAKINKILAENKINIEGQYLKTNENVGYVITDVSSNYDSKIIDSLKNMKETIKVRVLY